jgi:antitoxin (DNA-binding transcriptional repressor) of toxin-antitoxin stability system
MIEGMAQVHMSEAEVTANFAAVLEKLRQGAEVVVEQDHRPVAVISPLRGPGRSLDECIARAQRRGSGARLDGEFAEALEGILAERKPLDVSVWD